VSSWMFLLLLFPQALGEPEVSLVRAETLPPAIRTGEPFQLVLEIQVRDGVRVRFPDSLPPGDGFRTLGPACILEPGQGMAELGSTGDGGMRGREEDVRGRGRGTGTWRDLQVTYPLQWLRPGIHRLPPLRVRVEGPGSPEDPGGWDGRKGGSRVSGGWHLLSLGSVEVVSVLPSNREGMEPAGPVSFPPSGKPAAPGILALAGALGLLLAGTGLRMGKAAETGHGVQEGVGGDESPPSPGEARRRLREILEARVAGGERGERWEEAYTWFRILVQGGADCGSCPPTSWEILAFRQGEGGTADPLLARIFEKGDRMRFAGTEIMPGEPGDLMREMGEWMEVNGV